MEAGLTPYAEHFAKQGLHVLLFDYRHFGASSGQPRGLLSIKKQLADWEQAITLARSRPEIDPKKIALWGTSFSGGHVLTLAARDKKLAGIAVQNPMTDGLSATWNVLSYAGFKTLLQLTLRGLFDQAKALCGLSPCYLPIVAPPGKLALMSTPESEPGYLSIAPPDFENRVAGRLVLYLSWYRPCRQAAAITCPCLMIVCARDSVAPAWSAIQTAQKISGPTKLRIYDWQHFELYTGEAQQICLDEQSKFFQEVLGQRTPS